MAKVRVHVLISGLVQGVFFRYTAKTEAEKLNITGWIRNLPNNKVEAIFEGNKKGVQQIIDWCHQGPYGAVVRNVDVTWQEYSGEFGEFLIK